jgi:hypothetical protein
LENYFLDEVLWTEALSPLDAPEDWTRDVDQVRDRLRRIAKDFISYAVALKVAANVRYAFGNVDIMPSDCHGKSLDELCALFQESTNSDRTRFEEVIDEQKVMLLLTGAYQTLERPLDDNSDEQWKIDIPGRPILHTFASSVGLKQARAKRLYLGAANRSTERDPFAEVRAIFESFATHGLTQDSQDDIVPPNQTNES